MTVLANVVLVCSVSKCGISSSAVQKWIVILKGILIMEWSKEDQG